MIYDLKKRAEEELVNNLGHFWLKLIDNENGGFYGEVTYDLKANKKSEKGGIQTSRILWFFSAAYCATKNEEYKKAATNAYEFLRDKLIDEEFKGVYWMVDYLGNPIDTRKHIYCQSFAIYALNEYYKATKNEEALNLAMELFELIEGVGFNKENSAYLEEFDREWNITPNEMLSENGVIAEITTNTHLHVLEGYTTLYEITKNEAVREKLKNLIYTFYNKIYDKENHFLKIFFDGNWNTIIDVKSYGHDIEASWLIDEAYKVLNLKDEAIEKMIIDIAYNIKSQIQEDGSLINESENGVKDYTRIWWVQVEAMVGYLNAYERTHDEEFLKIVNNLMKYTMENMVDKREGGEWYWSIEPNGKPTERSVIEPWKTPYHNGRFCLEFMKRIGE